MLRSEKNQEMLHRGSRYRTEPKGWSLVGGDAGRESSKSERCGGWDENVAFKAQISVFIWLRWELLFGIGEDIVD